MTETSDKLQELVAQVAASYFASTHVNITEIPSVIAQIAASLQTVAGASPSAPAAEAEAPAKLTAAQIRKSITPAGLISFEDGKAYKTLKRHVSTHGLTLEQYRAKWGLPADYPSVAADYSAARSQMAKSLGLGQKGRAAPAVRGKRKA